MEAQNRGSEEERRETKGQMTAAAIITCAAAIGIIIGALVTVTVCGLIGG